MWGPGPRRGRPMPTHDVAHPLWCPLAGHTPVGRWTWVQTAMSLFVMAVGVALHRLRTP